MNVAIAFEDTPVTDDSMDDVLADAAHELRCMELHDLAYAVDTARRERAPHAPESGVFGVQVAR